MEKKNEMMKLNLQFFADGGEGTEPETPTNEEEETPKDTDNKEETLDKGSVRELIAELMAEREQAEKEKAEEEKRLSTLSKAERERLELEKLAKKLEKREQEIAKEQLRSDALVELKEKGLPTDFADYIIGENAEETLANINVFKGKFDEAVNEAVKTALRQDTPTIPNGMAIKGDELGEELLKEFNIK